MSVTESTMSPPLKEALSALSSMSASKTQTLAAIFWATEVTRGAMEWSLKRQSDADAQAWGALAFMAQANADGASGALELEWGPMGAQEYSRYLGRRLPELGRNPCGEIPLEPVIEWFDEPQEAGRERRAWVTGALGRLIEGFALPLIPAPSGRVRETLGSFIQRFAAHLPEPSEATQRMLREAFLPLIESALIAGESRAPQPARTRARI